MTSYRCFVAVSPDVFAQANDRFAGVRWARVNANTNLGLLELSGEFEDDEGDLEALFTAVPELEADSNVPTVFNLTASGDLVSEAFKSAGLNLGPGGGDGTTSILLVEEPAETPDDKPEEAEAPKEAPKETPKETPKEPDAKQGPEPPAATPLAQSIDSGLKAIRVPTDLWRSVPFQARRDIALQLILDLYPERSAYARNVRWTFAPEAELLNQASDGSAASELAQNVLKARVGLADHQVALAVQDVELRKQSVAYAGQGVELRKEAVKQQAEVTEMFGEFVTQLKKWTRLRTGGGDCW